MDRQSILPSPTEILDSVGKIFILEAEPGSQRSACLRDWSRAVSVQGITCHSVCTDVAQGGPWAGLRELFEALVPSLEEQAPELLVQHDYELVTVVPMLRRKLSPRNPNVTDLTPELERVRLYPADRAFRILHGLIDLLAEWKVRRSPEPWLLVCDAFDRSGHLVRKFFAELMRRRGASCQLVLLVTCSPGEEVWVSQLFEPAQLGRPIQLHLDPDPWMPVDPQEAARKAKEIESRADADPDNIEDYLPSLIRLWSLSDQPARALPWQQRALTIYAHRGVYEDSVGYGEAALVHLEESFPDDDKTRAWLVNSLSACYWACGQPERALQLVQQTLHCLKSLFWRGKVRYLLAMLYARYLPEKDYQKAEAELEAALLDLAEAEASSWECCFEIAFNRNGLAFIRYRQGRHLEAIRLCREAHQSLTENLPDDKHVLHKSVLLYNQAQVYASLGELDEAIHYYTEVIRIDPNYAEYYNERGNTFLKMGHLDLALADYQMSMSLSPPFPEVRTNLGHCYRLMGRIDQAVAAYGDSLDLDPRQVGVLVVRAQCYEALGMVSAALSDYETSLRLDPKQPLVLGNRACLLYQEGQISAALADLNQAITLSPGNEDLHRNRAIILTDLEEYDSAIADLETYLKLNSGAEDLDEVAQEISTLRIRQTFSRTSEIMA